MPYIAHDVARSSAFEHKPISSPLEREFTYQHGEGSPTSHQAVETNETIRPSSSHPNMWTPQLFAGLY